MPNDRECFWNLVLNLFLKVHCISPYIVPFLFSFVVNSLVDANELIKTHVVWTNSQVVMLAMAGTKG